MENLNWFYKYKKSIFNDFKTAVAKSIVHKQFISTAPIGAIAALYPLYGVKFVNTIAGASGCEGDPKWMRASELEDYLTNNLDMKTTLLIPVMNIDEEQTLRKLKKMNIKIGTDIKQIIMPMIIMKHYVAAVVNVKSMNKVLYFDSLTKSDHRVDRSTTCLKMVSEYLKILQVK